MGHYFLDTQYLAKKSQEMKHGVDALPSPPLPSNTIKLFKETCYKKHTNQI